MTNPTFTRANVGESLVLEARIHWRDHTPHWMTSNYNGRADMHIKAHRHGNWLSIDAREYCTDKGSSKRVMLDLDRETMRQLRDLLDEVLKP